MGFDENILFYILIGISIMIFLFVIINKKLNEGGKFYIILFLIFFDFLAYAIFNFISIDSELNSYFKTYKIKDYEVCEISKDKYFNLTDDGHIEILTKSGEIFKFNPSDMKIFKSDVNEVKVKTYDKPNISVGELYLKDSTSNYKKFEPSKDIAD